MIKVGPMQISQPEPLDPMEPFFTGTQADGGYWTDASRLSAHDHSGGLLGNPVAVTIPDGSITTADLDPSVLAPYSLTDGSKPFTGQVTMQADAVVRDALLFGQQGTALAPDATLSRTGPGALRADTHLGVGVNPAAWWTGLSALQLGQGGVLRAHAGSANTSLVNNSVIDPAIIARAVVAGAGSQVNLNADGSVNIATAPSVAAGAAQTFTTRMALAPTGTLTLSPASGQRALAAHMGGSERFALTEGVSSATNARLYAVGSLELNPGSSYVHPSTDNATSLGAGSLRWNTVYAVAGAINTSSAAVKEGITPLDPAVAMEAVRNTPAVTFDYLAPARGPEWYDLPDDPEQAERVLQQRLTAAPLEAAARHQAGFIAENCDPLFLVGEGQTSPGNSVGVLLAALRDIDTRLTALEEEGA